MSIRQCKEEWALSSDEIGKYYGFTPQEIRREIRRGTFIEPAQFEPDIKSLQGAGDYVELAQPYDGVYVSRDSAEGYISYCDKGKWSGGFPQDCVFYRLNKKSGRYIPYRKTPQHLWIKSALDEHLWRLYVFSQCAARLYKETGIKKYPLLVKWGVEMKAPPSVHGAPNLLGAPPGLFGQISV